MEWVTHSAAKLLVFLIDCICPQCVDLNQTLSVPCVSCVFYAFICFKVSPSAIMLLLYSGT